MKAGQRIVVGVDGAEPSLRALAWAVREARERELVVEAVRVWQPHAVLSGPGPLLMRPELAPHRVRQRYGDALVRAVRACLADAPGPEVRAELLVGHAAPVLVERSADAAMLVLGDRGRARMADAVHGGTIARCVHRAQCPVVVIPAGLRQPETPSVPPQGATGDPVLG